MSRRVEIKECVVKSEATIVACDICKEEMEATRMGVHGYDFSQLQKAMTGSREWWKKPFDKIVGIRKGSIEDEERSDFDVHVDCAYKVIKQAVRDAE